MSLPWLLTSALAIWAIWQSLRVDALSRRVRDAERMILELADMVDDAAPRGELVLDQPVDLPAAPPARNIPWRERFEGALATPVFGVNLAWAATLAALGVFAYALHPLWGVIRIDASASAVFAALALAYAAGAVLAAAAMRVGRNHGDRELHGMGVGAIIAFGFAAVSLAALFIMRGAEMLSPIAPTDAHRRALTLLWIAYGAGVLLFGLTTKRKLARAIGGVLFAAMTVKFVLYDMPSDNAGLRAFLFLALVIGLIWALFTAPSGRRRPRYRTA